MRIERDKGGGESSREAVTSILFFKKINDFANQREKVHL